MEGWELRGRKREAEVLFLFYNLIVSVGKVICSQPWWSIKIKCVYLTSQSAVHNMLMKQGVNSESGSFGGGAPSL